MNYEAEIRELKRRLDLAETRFSQHMGQFEFISGQLRDAQLYMHARFADMDKRFDGVDKRFAGADKRFDKVESEMADLKRLMEDRFNAVLRAIAEQFAERDPRA